jgi:hypothetical protein
MCLRPIAPPSSTLWRDQLRLGLRRATPVQVSEVMLGLAHIIMKGVQRVSDR